MPTTGGSNLSHAGCTRTRGHTGVDGDAGINGIIVPDDDVVWSLGRCCFNRINHNNHTNKPAWSKERAKVRKAHPPTPTHKCMLLKRHLRSLELRKVLKAASLKERVLERAREARVARGKHAIGDAGGAAQDIQWSAVIPNPPHRVALVKAKTKHTHTHTDTDTDRHRHRHTHTQTDRQTDTDTHTHTLAHSRTFVRRRAARRPPRATAPVPKITHSSTCDVRQPTNAANRTGLWKWHPVHNKSARSTTARNSSSSRQQQQTAATERKVALLVSSPCMSSLKHVNVLRYRFSSCSAFGVLKS